MEKVLGVWSMAFDCYWVIFTRYRLFDYEILLGFEKVQFGLFKIFLQELIQTLYIL